MPALDQPQLEALTRATRKAQEYLRERVNADALDLARLWRHHRDEYMIRVQRIYDSFLGKEPTLIRAKGTDAWNALMRATQDMGNELGHDLALTSVENLQGMLATQRRQVAPGLRGLFGDRTAFVDQPKSVQDVLADVTTTVQGGSTFTDRVFNMTDDMKNQAWSDIRRGLVNGDDFDTVRARLQKTFGVDKLAEPKYNAYGSVKAYENLARDAWNQNMSDIADDLSDEARAVWYATLDPRTTPGCLARHGRTIDDLGETPPRHINCRCTVAVLPSDTDLGSIMGEAVPYLEALGYSRRRAFSMESLREAEWDEGAHPRDDRGRFASGAADFGRMSTKDFDEQSGPPGEFLYHTTSRANLDDIATGGLEPQDPSYRQEQDAWPDGGDEPRVYFATRPGGAIHFSEPDHVLLRVKTAALPKLRAEFKDRDYYTRRPIAPEALEVMQTDGSWAPMREAEWDEALHPRGDGGKFAEKGSGTAVADDEEENPYASKVDPTGRPWVNDDPAITTDSAEPSDPRYAEGSELYVKGKYVKDPDHKMIRGENAGFWGGSHTGSSAITGASATMMGLTGYREIEDDYDQKKQAARFLDAIYASPGSHEALFHGFENTRKIDWKVGDTFALPLTATSGNRSTAQGFGVRLDIENQRGVPTIFEFPRGTPMMGYQKWGRDSDSDPDDFNHVWSEAIIAGKYRVVEITKRRAHGFQHDRSVRDAHSPVVTVVRVEPTHKWNPKAKKWEALGG